MRNYNYANDLKHFGIKGMKWGHRKKTNKASSVSSKVEKGVYAIGAKVNPRETKYKLRKLTNKTNDDVKSLADLTLTSLHVNGKLPSNEKALKAIESVGIQKHKDAKYSNLDHRDLQNLKTYTDSARYSRSVNGFLAIGTPKEYAAEAAKLKKPFKRIL